MPSYKVIAPGFFGGQQYHPEGKRDVLHTDKPFPKKDGKELIPSWLKSIKAETAAEKKKRIAAEKKAKAAADKAKADDTDEIKGASFMGDADDSSSVETL